MNNNKISIEVLTTLTGYFSQNEFVKNEIQNWLIDAKHYCTSNNLSLLDLFYWEQRLGNWGALYPFEQDIAIEEIAPISNRYLLMNGLRIDNSLRKFPKYTMMNKLIKHLWKDVLNEPINPDSMIIKDYIKNKTILKYYILKISNYFR